MKSSEYMQINVTIKSRTKKFRKIEAYEISLIFVKFFFINANIIALRGRHTMKNK